MDSKERSGLRISVDELVCELWPRRSRKRHPTGQIPMRLPAWLGRVPALASSMLLLDKAAKLAGKLNGESRAHGHEGCHERPKTARWMLATNSATRLGVRWEAKRDTALVCRTVPYGRRMVSPRSKAVPTGQVCALPLCHRTPGRCRGGVGDLKL